MFPTHIPDELVFQILNLLPFRDQLSFSNTSHKANLFMRDQHFWKLRIKALSPQSDLAPTKQNFANVFKRALQETAFLNRNQLKIRMLLQTMPVAMAEVEQKLKDLSALCLNPWGENHVNHLATINRLLNEINQALVTAQLPAYTTALRLECLTRLPEVSLVQHRALFAGLQKLELQENRLERLPHNIDILQECCSLNLYNNPMRFLPLLLEDCKTCNFCISLKGIWSISRQKFLL